MLKFDLQAVNDQIPADTMVAFTLPPPIGKS